jgi:putative hydrolase of HD superfamily
MNAAASLVALRALKHLPRAGWVRVGVATPESVAAHSWGVALWVLTHLPPGLDLGRALAYAILHDAAEAIVGDITPHDGISRAEKAARESRAARALLAPWPPLLAVWEAYEAQEDDEARFVRQLDRADMAWEATCLERDGAGDLSAFHESAARVVTDEVLVATLSQLRASVGKTAADGVHSTLRRPG